MLDDTLEIFLLNKTNPSNTVNIEIDGKKKIIPAGTIVSLVDTPDQWGTLNECSIQMREKSFEVSLSPLS